MFFAAPRLLVLLSVLAAGCSPDKPAPSHPVPNVGFIVATPQTVPYPLDFVAQTESSRQVEIVARVAGFLDRIAYNEGQFVKEGQLLFQIDPKPFKAQLDAARGELEAQKARLSTASATLKRVKPLTAQNAMSQADLDRAQGDFDTATAAVHSAQAKVREAELNLEYTTVRAPLAGAAGRALQREGAYVGAAAETAKLTYVAALDPIWVTFSVSQNQAARLREMAEKKLLVRPDDNRYEVELMLPGGARYPHRGRIDFADPSFSQDTGSFMVRAAVPNPDKDLRPGMFLTAHVHGAFRPSAFVLPQLAVQQGAKGHFVVLANAQDQVELRPVVVGTYVNDREIVVEQGLNAGDRVIVDGFARLAPNAPVKPVPAAPATDKTQAPDKVADKAPGPPAADKAPVAPATAAK